ncbi:MerR family DNA-binding transcriptional regulator [Streptosporangium fragile]|uniref:MerR family DNA-binding transcriptional regulator n=1 Tax=Streptosporangium fragile TaxID=46186 RepID=UPI003CD06787
MAELLLPGIAVDVPAEGLSTGQAAKATGVGIEALRYYEREGPHLGPISRDGGGERGCRADRAHRARNSRPSRRPCPRARWR